jgi:hypothetical protein
MRGSTVAGELHGTAANDNFGIAFGRSVGPYWGVRRSARADDVFHRQVGGSFSSVAAVKLDDAVFESQTAQLRNQRLLVEHLQVEPAIFNLVGRRVMQPQGIGTDGAEVIFEARRVMHFDQKLGPALLQ